MALAACSGDRPSSEFFAPYDVHTLVVDALLVVDRPAPELRLTQTLPPREPFSLEAASVNDATIIVRHGTEAIHYLPDGRGLGTYRPVESVLIAPSAQYTLEVRVPDGRQAFAETKTPERMGKTVWVVLDEESLEVTRTMRTYAELGDSVYFAPENQLVYLEGLPEVRFTKIDVPAYHIGLSSLDLDSELVINTDWLSEDQLADIERSVSSPPLEATDGTVKMPWFAIAFAGRYQVRVSAMDTNYFDLIRSTPQFSGGGSFGGEAGDAFERPIFHVQGGIGLFGSAAVDTMGFNVLPADDGRAGTN